MQFVTRRKNSCMLGEWKMLKQPDSISNPRRRRQKGHAVLEVAFLMPWLIFLFVGAFDMGFYSYALICTENAARVATMYTSTSNTTWTDSSTACSIALGELGSLRNLRGVTTCDSLPLIVSVASATGPDGNSASQVSVTYQSDQLIPIPGLLMGRLTLTRTAQMRLRS
jgi:Flp pilus assembly protein TadG